MGDTQCDCLLVGRLVDPVERARWVMPEDSMIGAGSWPTGDGFRVQVAHLSFDVLCDPSSGRKRDTGRAGGLLGRTGGR